MKPSIKALLLTLSLGVLAPIGIGGFAYSQQMSGVPGPAGPAGAPGAAGSTGPVNTADVKAYQMQAGGSAIAMQSGKSVLVITTSTLIAAQTVLLPASPQDGQIVRVTSKGAITLLTVQDSAGNAVSSFALSPLAPGNLFMFTASLGWVKIA